MDAMAQLPLPARLGAGTFPAKLWSLVNDPRVCSLRWDSEARGLLVDRPLFERELLRPGGAQGPAPHAFRATQFSSFVRQLYRYGFRKVPGRAGAAAPGDAGAWLHYTNPWFRRDRPDLLLRIRRRSAANTQRRAAGPEERRRPPCGSQQLPGPRPLPDERHGRSGHFSPACSSWQCWLCCINGLQLSAECTCARGITSAGSWPGIEKMIREIRNSLPVKAPSAQGNNNVAPESPREDPMNRAAAEEVSSGTESCRNSSPEPEEPGKGYASEAPCYQEKVKPAQACSGHVLSASGYHAL
ncbi:hypothetical protein DUI87_26166 [Hirundo rustica rustica]|uniref:HSF-type DNA-binding domain-containing protein n=1 Tax=Hirundo rustica rustica TaxID=333673 RepID=A0A3M0J7W1_HIRRU|nr:hypothetical protein DUI87_26166 [Hirundo rustica rustica]